VPFGEIDAEGGYRLSTAGKPGAPPGWYRVMIVAVARSEGSHGKHRRQVSLISRKYTAVETSGLALEVVEDAGPSAYDLKLLPPR
jgi:hypothetical protein